ncbi:MAG: NRDE family protein [Acidimicrobiales bacterium]
MCTVLLRLDPDGRWPLLLGAIRDEFVERSWDPPARHWEGPFARLVGGRDRQAGGTWLALDPAARAVGALLNAGRREEPEDGTPRPTRGTLALRILTAEGLPDDVSRYDRFHLLRATLDGASLWSWDGEALSHQGLAPGDHIIVNEGLDTSEDPLVPHFAPLLAALPSDPGAWRGLLAGDGLDPGDARALVVRKEIEGHLYGTTSGSLLAVSRDELRYQFTATPADAGSWYDVSPG